LTGPVRCRRSVHRLLQIVGATYAAWLPAGPAAADRQQHDDVDRVDLPLLAARHPAIINASKVNQLLGQGDYAGAQAAASESKKWSKLALIIGLVLWGIGLICCIINFVILGSLGSTT